MATKTKKRSNKTKKRTPYVSTVSIDRGSIDSRDLNEDEQQQLTNSTEEHEQYKIQSTDSNDHESKTTVEQEEDNEQRRKEDEVRGKEQV